MVQPMMRAVVFQEGEWWIIHFLEYDLATGVRRLEDVPGEIQRCLLVLFAASHQLGVKPFSGYSPAPSRYWRMFEAAQTRLETVQVELPPGLDVGPDPRIDTRIAA
jgi:hypothetical protein